MSTETQLILRIHRKMQELDIGVDTYSNQEKLEITEQMHEYLRQLHEWYKGQMLVCPYTFAHTRHWCGYPNCRDS